MYLFPVTGVDPRIYLMADQNFFFCLLGVPTRGDEELDGCRP